MLFQLLCLIGEGFGADSDEVNGGVVNVRQRGDKCQIWTKSCNKGSMMRIGYVQTVFCYKIYSSCFCLPYVFIIKFQASHPYFD